MVESSQNYLRKWRVLKGLTQEELADAVGTSKSVISDLENAKRGLSPKWLRRLSPVLDTQPGHLLDIDPDTVDTDIIDIWSRIAEKDKAQAIKTLQSFVRSGTDN